jgi:2-hydroxy-6-oxonona-2,4-dienedioate hydrolase
MGRGRGFLLAGCAAVAATIGTIVVSYRMELGRTRDAAGQGSMVATLAGGTVEYADRGTGLPLLSIHGAGGGFDQGLANAQALAGDGFRVIAPSRFGYLRTPVPPDASTAAQADAHAALLARLKLDRVVVIGVSAGARSAVALALRHPDKVAALILVVPALYAPGRPVSIEVGRGNKFAFWAVNAGGDFAWWAAETLAPSMLIRFLGVRPGLIADAPAAERDRVMSMVRRVEPLSLRFAGINIDSIPELREAPLDEISAPTMIISARDDLFNTLPAAEFAAARIPGSRLLVYESGGHLLVGKVGQVRAAVGAFLADARLIPQPAASQ